MALAQNPTPINRAEGVTPTERHLKRLGDVAFLTPWSYPEVRNDRGMVDGKGPGQEVADFLVVFDNDVVIFSVKASEFPETGDLQIQWNRWFQRTIEESLIQLGGGQRWIKAHPHRLFVDRACTQRFPLPIPDPSVAKYHRIVVAHGASERCRRELGGRGSLRVIPSIVDSMHRARPEDGGTPFHIGQLDTDLGFVHVFDETSIDIVLTELDTISDFLNYLTWKERLIQDGRIERVAGELELLAYYLERVRVTHQYLPELPDDVDRLIVDEGLWDAFADSAARESRRAANESSFIVDRLIERFSGHAYAGTQHSASTPGVTGAARVLRFLAREPRTRRRIIGDALEELFSSTPEDDFAAMTVVHPSQHGEPHYVLLLVSSDHPSRTYEEYRDLRFWMLRGLCRAVRYQFPVAEDIVGIATELVAHDGCSEDALHCDGRNFTELDATKAKEFIEHTGALQNLRHSAGIASYFPNAE